MMFIEYLNDKICRGLVLMYDNNTECYKRMYSINESNDIKKYTIGRKKQWKSLEPPKTIVIENESR